MSEEDFLKGEWLECNSSNVAAARYDRENQQFTVRYHNGAAYRYDGVTEYYAVNFYYADSKGGWIWDNMRIRGSKSGSRFPFTRIA